MYCSDDCTSVGVIHCDQVMVLEKGSRVLIEYCRVWCSRSVEKEGWFDVSTVVDATEGE